MHVATVSRNPHPRAATLQLVRQGQKDRLDVVAVAVRLSRRLKQRHPVKIRKLLRKSRSDHNLIVEIALVPDQYARNVFTDVVPIAFFDPTGQTVKGRPFGDVVHENNSAGIAIVVWYHAFPKALLTCSVPQLQLQ